MLGRHEPYLLQYLPQLHGDLLDALRIEAHETVELGAAWQCRECSSQMTISVAIEVPFAVEAAPAGEDSEGDDLALWQREASGPGRFFGGWDWQKSSTMT